MRIPPNERRLSLLVLSLFVVLGLVAWQKAPETPEGSASNFSLWSPIISSETRKPVPAASVQESTTTAPEAAVIPTMSYGKAVNTYGNRRFQFAGCSGRPGKIIVKKGSVVMLDNRDDRERTIGVGSKSYDIKAYDFKLFATTEVGDLSVTCDGGGAGTLSVEP